MRLPALAPARRPVRSTARAAALALALGTLPAVLPLAPAAGASAAPSHALTAPSRTTKTRVVHWPSGTYAGNAADAGAQVAFGRYRSRTTDVASIYQPYASWDDIRSYTYNTDVMTGYRGTLSVGLAMVPRDGSSLTDVVAGRHDEDFRSFARNLVTRGRGNAYVRLGWEFNGDWFPWAARNPVLWKAAWRREARVMHAVAPQLRMEWDANLGYSQVRRNPQRDLYPGDDVVNVVGVDAYDNAYNHVKDAASWARYLRQDGGLQTYADFARRHRKPLALPEWGLNVGGGADNPFFIQRIHDFLVANAPRIAYESYFNDVSPDQRSSLYAPVLNPRSSALYARLWHQVG